MTTHPARYLTAVLLVGTLLGGCTARSATTSSIPVLPAGGTNRQVGDIHVDDVLVDAPAGLQKGDDAPLHVALTNDSARADALTKVSTPVATRVSLERSGVPVDRLVVPAEAQTNLEHCTEVLLSGVRRSIRPGQWFPVTLQFARAGAVTVYVTAGPIGQSPAMPARLTKEQ